MTPQKLTDTFGRRFSYLRLSITDACNFRCVYCLPNGYLKPKDREPDLSVVEIRNLVAAFAELGTWKVRLTGGEPTLRRDLIAIATAVSSVDGIRKIALSTNGYRLAHTAKQLKLAGVSALNVSIDSLDPQRFTKLTGSDKLDEILRGIDAAFAEGFKQIKINSVLMRDGFDENYEEEFHAFLDFVRRKPLTVRFIELMRTGKNQDLFQQQHLSGSAITHRLASQGWIPQPRQEADGPAVEWGHPDYLGKMGVIAPYSKDFCQTCNRLRVTSTGGLRLCLFAEGNFSLRHLLQRDTQRDELKELIRSLLNKKEISHYLPEGRYGNNQTFSAIGG